MMDKPIFIAAQKGVKIPNNLLKLGPIEHFKENDPKDLQRAVTRLIKSRENQ